jgi:hypothetical protein
MEKGEVPMQGIMPREKERVGRFPLTDCYVAIRDGRGVCDSAEGDL